MAENLLAKLEKIEARDLFCSSLLLNWLRLSSQRE